MIRNLLFIHRFFIDVIVSISTLFVIVSCGASQNQQEGTAQEASIVSNDDNDKIDIPISVNLSHTEDEDQKAFAPSLYEIITNNSNEMSIDINDDYYKKYISGQRFEVPNYGTLMINGFEFLYLDLDIVNNTDKSLDINKLDICVKESVPDENPFIYIQTTDDKSNTISFINGVGLIGEVLHFRTKY